MYDFTLKGQNLMLRNSMLYQGNICTYMCVNADLWHCRDSSYHTGENFGGRKISMRLLCRNNLEIISCKKN